MNRAQVTSLRAHMAEHYPELLGALSPALDHLETWDDWTAADMRVAVSCGIVAFLQAEQQSRTESSDMASNDVAGMLAKIGTHPNESRQCNAEPSSKEPPPL